jgi:hypothetical protein
VHTFVHVKGGRIGRSAYISWWGAYRQVDIVHGDAGVLKQAPTTAVVQVVRGVLKLMFHRLVEGKRRKIEGAVSIFCVDHRNEKC